MAWKDKDGNTYRNLEEQVLKNKDDILNLYNTQEVLNEFGLKLIDEYTTFPAVLPVYDEYGDAFGVYVNGIDGSEGLYIYIWTRGNAAAPQDHFLAIGRFPAPGPEGPQGPQGIQGLQGPLGPQGQAGPSGAQGPQGLPGIQGIQGIPGTQGPQGNPGVNGTSFNIQTGKYKLAMLPNFSSTSLGDAFIVTDDPNTPAGQLACYYHAYGGTDWDIITPFNGEQGPQGIQGPKGDTGAQGIQGIQGPKGDTGSTGPQGPIGPQGPKGDTGATGAQGPKGDTGAIGPQGPTGPKGDTGAIGPQGPTGPKGDTPIRYEHNLVITYVSKGVTSILRTRLNNNSSTTINTTSLLYSFLTEAGYGSSGIEAVGIYPGNYSIIGLIMTSSSDVRLQLLNLSTGSPNLNDAALTITAVTDLVRSI